MNGLKAKKSSLSKNILQIFLSEINFCYNFAAEIKEEMNRKFHKCQIKLTAGVGWNGIV